MSETRFRDYHKSNDDIGEETPMPFNSSPTNSGKLRTFSDDSHPEPNREPWNQCYDEDELEFDNDVDERKNSDPPARVENSSDSASRTPSLNNSKTLISHTGDSPYFDQFVEKEMQSLSVLTDTLKDISSKAKAFVKCGLLMADAAKTLSQACNMESVQDLSGNENSTEAEEVRKKKIAFLMAIKKGSIGEEMASVLKVLSQILNEFAESQSQMCDTVNASLSTSLEDFIGGDLLNARKLKNEADEATDLAESAFAKYLHGKHGQLAMPTSADVEQSLTSAMNSWNMISESMGNQFKNWMMTNESDSAHDGSTGKDSDHGGGVRRRFRRGKAPSGDKKDEQQERILATASLIQNLHEIRLAHGNAELVRFQLLRDLDLLKCRRNVELSGSGIVSLNGIKSHFMYCSDYMLGLQSRIDDLLSQQMASKSILDSHQAPWNERESSLRQAVNEVNTDATNFSLFLDTLNKGPGVNSEDMAKLDPPPPLEVIENDVKIWNASSILAEKCSFYRDQTPGVVFEGWLYKKASSRISLNAWSRRWFILDNKAIYYLHEGASSENPKRGLSRSSMERVKVCDVVLCTVREVNDKAHSKGNEPLRFCFEILSPNNKPYMLQACGPHDLKMWVDSIRRCVERQLIHGTLPTHTLSQNSSTMISSSGSIENGIPSLQEADDGTSPQTPTSKNPIVKQILEANPTCADCGTSFPDWASLNLGVLICIECSGVHRSLGVQYSKVRSLTLDELTPVQYSMLLSLGNTFANSIWESGTQKGWSKPQADCSRKTKEEWIKSKYMWRGFIEHNEEGDFDETARIQNLSSNLYNAAKHANLCQAAECLAFGARVDWVNEEEGGKTCLHIVAVSKKQTGSRWYGLEIAELLIQNGAKVDVLDRDQHSVLDVAVIGAGEIEMVEYLMAKV